MDIVKALRELYNEKKQLDLAISSLEARLKTVRKGKTASISRRGRKSMSPAERLEVSKRMSLYWETRRAQKRSSQEPPPSSTDASSLSEEEKASTTSA